MIAWLWGWLLAYDPAHFILVLAHQMQENDIFIILQKIHLFEVSWHHLMRKSCNLGLSILLFLFLEPNNKYVFWKSTQMMEISNSNLFQGRWSDIAGRRFTLLVCLFMTGLGYSMFAMATTVTVLFVARIPLGEYTCLRITCFLWIIIGSKAHQSVCIISQSSQLEIIFSN